MTNSSDFIARLADKLGRPTPTSVEPIEVKVPIHQLNSIEERMETLLANWDALGGKGSKAKTPEEAANTLKEWFNDLNPQVLKDNTMIIWGDLPDFAKATLAKLHWVPQSFPDISIDRSVRIKTAADAQLGITSADFGITQAATLVLMSNSRRGRSVSLLPPRHLAFLAASKIKDDLSEVMEELLSLETPPAAIEFISGPSRTSDIEMDLSIGVHGPIEVYLVIMADQ
ncbi:lactate utilization protein C [Desulfitobacterium sp. Sab5]|uniref:LutC/YkgG family protein n=1 Tax=Desulfitobacterium nosdiversum TaxID=3375356 RepID=UPI003CF80040